MTEWTWLAVEERRRRNAVIYTLWTEGVDRQRLAEVFDLTPTRISQILKERQEVIAGNNPS